MFIVLEGADAVGKETQSKRLAEAFRVKGKEAKVFSFHRYATPLGRVIKAHLKRQIVLAHNAPTVVTEEQMQARYDQTVRVRPDPHEADAMMFQCLAIADKYIGAAEILRFVRDGGVAICDRWWQSAFAYGAADGLDPDWILDAHRFLPVPDYNILIQLSYEEAKRRRPVPEDRYEEQTETQIKVRQHYQLLWDRPPDFAKNAQWLQIDGSDDPETVTQTILENIRDEETKGGA